MHALLVYLATLLAGLTLGVGGGFLGIGGGIVAIPLLRVGLNMSQPLAQGTALVLIVPNVLIGFIRYRQRHSLDLRTIATMCACASVTAFIAARATAALPAQMLQDAFCIFLLGISAYYLIKRRTDKDDGRSRPLIGERYLPILGILSGIMSGVFSVGGGLVVTPILVALFGFKQTRAQGIALALVVPGSLAALASNALSGHVDWTVGILLSVGGLVTVSWGVALAHRVAPHYLRWAFCAVLILSAILLHVFG